ncbi:hypothetical protein RHS01_09700 [Rhizoctonia solani]|uniref:Uncharacterized protein n=1 Tax=Rhizoctonia solani TaxID=456999 RepID=A0A8H7I674_9AGAM|nr:hypothetical protein RHS01_09700 [Rhizoctonia solani]
MNRSPQYHQHYGATTHVPLPVYYIAPAPPAPRRHRTRFINAFLGAVLILWVTHHLFHRHHWYIHGRPGTGSGRDGDWEWDIHMDLQGINHDAEGCAVWDHYSPSHRSDSIASNVTSRPHVRGQSKSDEGDKFTFSIPTSSRATILSHKEQLVVEVEVIKDPEGEARVCALPSSGDSDVYGVGFYVRLLLSVLSPFNTDCMGGTIVTEEQASIPTVVLACIYRQSLPPHHRQTQHLNALETRLGQFEHIFPDLSQSFDFERLDLAAANVPMTFEDVVAGTIDVSNANAKIQGKLTGSSRVAVRNANAPVDAEVTLTGPGEIILDNANSIIQSNHVDDPFKVWRLLSSPRLPHLAQKRQCTDQRDDRISTAPFRVLPQRGHRDGGCGRASERSVRGGFKLSNLFRSPTVELTNKKDPSGEGRHRYLSFEKRGSTTIGHVAWGTEEHAPGQVDLSTVGKSIGLYF